MKPSRKVKDKTARAIARKSDIDYVTTCPCCGKGFKTPLFSSLRAFKAVARKHKSVTMNCPKCLGLILLEKGKLYDFHKHLNKKDKRWPADGKNTWSVG